MIILCVTDDGQGFNPEEQDQSVGHGLANMLARAEELNGSCNIQSAPGEGTQICLRLPRDSDSGAS
jgi:signal transduction histidine kinase